MEKEAPKRKVPRKATRRYLENAAEYYLQRFSTSTANFRRVMMRKVQLSAQHHETDPQEGAEIIEELIARFQRVGVLNDEQYAELRASSLHRRGNSKRLINAKLKQKGLDDEVIEGAYNSLKEESKNPELDAARAFAKRRRLGPYRTRPPKENQQEKDLAAMARAGFSYDLAIKVLGKLDDMDGEVFD
ncbi:MAG: RecX family transcriptional regulator [Rhodospirillales bacterium]|nr:RecX family transcriptional regulator [Rhodospirillales bacterium]